MNSFVIYFSFILLNGRLFFKVTEIGYQLVHIIVFSMFWVVIFINFMTILRSPNVRKVTINKGLQRLFVIFLVMICVGYLRAWVSGLLSLAGTLSAIFRIVTIVLLLFSVFIVSTIRDDKSILKKGLFSALNLYIILNVILQFVGVRSVNVDPILDFPGPARLLSLLGFYTGRIHFPLASGVNTFGILSAFALVANCALLSGRGYSSRAMLLAKFGILCSSFALISADSRAATAYSIVCIAAIMLLRRGVILKLSFLPFLAPILSMMLPIIAQFLPYDFLYALSRGNRGVLMPGREIIWENVSELLFHAPSFLQLIGYGLWGQVTSGILDSYFVNLFSDAAFQNRILSSNVHNFFLQQLLDFGYLGACFSIYFIFRVLRTLLTNYVRNTGESFKFHAFMLILLILEGMSEAVPTIAIPDIFVIFIYICVWTIVMTKEDCKGRIQLHI